MSFDIFLMCFRHGKPALFKREIFEEIFLPYCDHPEAYRDEPEYTTVSFPDGSGGVIYCSSDTERTLEMRVVDGDSHNEKKRIVAESKEEERGMSHMMFNHCGGDAFFQAMYTLADRTNSMINWPNVPAIFVFPSEEARKHVMDGIIEEGDRVLIVRSGAEIIDAIASS
jgi:hypothetical protein